MSYHSNLDLDRQERAEPEPGTREHPHTQAPADHDESPYYAGGMYVADLSLAARLRQLLAERAERDARRRAAAFPETTISGVREHEGADAFPDDDTTDRHRAAEAHHLAETHPC